MTDTARYAYAVARHLDAAAVDGVPGVHGADLSVVRHCGLDAVLSDVPLPEFDEQGLKQNLEDFTWLEAVARAHDDVVWAVASSAPTAPLRLATIFLDDDAVRRRLEELQGQLTEVLDRVEGRAEWSVKVIAPPRGGASESPAPTSGAEFLRRRKAEAEEREQHLEDGTRAAEEVHQELVALTVASRLLPPQDPQLTGHRGTMVLNGAYLVPHDAGMAFADRVRDLGARHTGLSVEVAGPWPPYSFAVLEEM
ncbi:GvpL/GvpF family gas vesicle protein [Nocardioides euryhalodurans]|uniref:GvpL/GvpF family gas vesicle protein n=1 Tax=Nocardioides euryhalodurans TaxID=2518370 RepID=UPI001ABE2541|nr:GvpL/GvpF family gas vesicle protein [Nocardioides euryhalodurans]